jgi:rod shape-determining protein MreC
MSSASLPVACGLVLVGVGLSFAPDGLATRLRGAVADATRPGQQAVGATVESMRAGLASLTSQSARTQHVEVTRLKRELDEAQARGIALAARLANVNDERELESALPTMMRGLPQLASVALIEAAVLGDVHAEQWRSGKLLDRGESHGVRESALVVNSRQPLVDVGQDGELSSEDSVLMGRRVIGKIEHVGRWTSTLLLLTDAAYRGRAQLVQEAEKGFVFGARGILKGQGGALCNLEGISPTESARVGDGVYTADRDGLFPTPLYYGRVVEATLGPDDREWTVRVEPAPLPSRLTSVQVLRTSVNTERLAAGDFCPAASSVGRPFSGATGRQ